MKKVQTSDSAKMRILKTASDLFYRQGYRSTGTNEIIKKAGVAKASFFYHFPTKEALALAYLQDLHSHEAENLLKFVNERQKPSDRFLAVIKWIEPWIKSNKLRGCGFLNMVSEVPDKKSPLRKMAKKHYAVLGGLIRQLTQELVNSDPKRYRHLDVSAIADRYVAIVVGAIALSETAQNTWPARQGVEVVNALIPIP
ncbi:hypothetical protein A2Z33_00795 [Candidatus Gottesmanbacteria bacterium RBG_16_52_11]|uniref:HTH tetR-type domain-containing protein n=1 Tax=Candidatus Gottesmanbacteria bacterium RBG_16_52_11 TaxID=1798374 RepID=A0A1F5YNM9_9BACT|nr:MAG: hypothetical protein A2Z33_00795 [Candidatus Gottesmanbacteria bacterium RBG_16_52_11]